MNVQDLKIGIRLEIEQLKKDGKRKGPVYVSQLLHAPTEKDVLIASPIYESAVVTIHDGAPLRVISLHERHGLLSFNAIVKSTVRKGHISMLLLEVTSEFIKIQRRGYYRLPCTLSISYCLKEGEEEECTDTAGDQAYKKGVTKNISATYRLVENKDTDNTDKKDCKKAVTKNLSATGACIVVDEMVPTDSIIKLFIPVRDIRIEALCKVLRCSCVHNPRGDKYELGMHIMSCAKQHQEQLVKYIFDQQRELLKKDLLDR